MTNGEKGDSSTIERDPAAAAGNDAAQVAKSNGGVAVAPEGGSGNGNAAGEGFAQAGEAFLSGMAAAVVDHGPAPDPLVSVAFSLGWQMAELYQPAVWPTDPPARGKSLPGVSNVIIGCSSPDEVDANAAIVRRFNPLDAAQRQALEERTRRHAAAYAYFKKPS